MSHQYATCDGYIKALAEDKFHEMVGMGVMSNYSKHRALYTRINSENYPHGYSVDMLHRRLGEEIPMSPKLKETLIDSVVFGCTYAKKIIIISEKRAMVEFIVE